jgi:carbohydrate kinase (thermoresistant glucokinase family)
LQQDRQNARIAVVMGVSGSGKTTIGRALARRLGWCFEEGDALHPPANIAKMSAGQPLDDHDRAPWLAAIAARIDDCRRRGESAVISCSALKRAYREVIIGNRPEVRLIYLTASRRSIAARLAQRRGHFMPANLLDSQFEILEPPGPEENAITVSVDQPVEAITDRLVVELSRGCATTPSRVESYSLQGA